MRTHYCQHEARLMTRLTRQQAAAHLQVTESTIDRMIRSGHLATETRTPRGPLHSLKVLLDDNAAYSTADEEIYSK